MRSIQFLCLPVLVRVIGESLKFLQDKKFYLSQKGVEMTKDLAESFILERFSRGH